MNNKTQTLEIYRDGELDQDVLKARERAQRIETVKNIGFNVITGLERAVKLTGRGLGEFAVAAYHDSDLYRDIQRNFSN